MSLVTIGRMEEFLDGQQVRTPGVPEYFQRVLPLLDEQDGELLKVHCAGQLGQRQTARLLGIHHSTVRHRIARLIRRLTNPAVACLLDASRLSNTERRIAIEYFLRRRGLRQIARSNSITLAEVRRTLDVLRGYVRGHRAADAERFHNNSK